MATLLDGLFVKLAFEVDKESQAKFNESVRATEKGVSLAAGKMGAAVVAAEAMIAVVRRLATNLKGLEQGYNPVSKFGGDAGNLKALERTFEKFGGSAQEARSAVDSFYHQLQNAPGLAENIEQQLGVEVIDKATGQFRDLSLVIPEIGERLSHMDRATANSYASMLGLGGAMDEITRGGFSSEMKAQSDAMRALGADYQSAGKDAHTFLNQTRDMLTTLADVTFGGFYNLIKGYFGENWVRDMTDWLASRIRGVFAGLKAGIDASKGISWRNPLAKGRAFYNAAVSSYKEERDRTASTLENVRRIQDGNTTNSDQLTEAQQPSISTINGVVAPAARLTEAQGTRVDAGMEYLMSRGMTREQAAGVLGVFLAESGLDPAAKAKMKGDNGVGIAQWTRNRQGDRQKTFWNIYGKLFGDASQYGGDITKVPFKRQLDVFLAERPTITQAIMNASGTREATEIMERGYENGGGTYGNMASDAQINRIYGDRWGNGYERQMRTRLGYAQAVLNRWGADRMAARGFGGMASAGDAGKVNSDNRVTVTQNFNFGHQAGTPEAIASAASSAAMQTNQMIFSPVGG